MTEGKAIRTFLALEAPEGVRGEMARIQERLRRGVSGSIRWVAEPERCTTRSATRWS